MRFAAIADIHGNALALEAVLADIAALGISDIVNLKAQYGVDANCDGVLVWKDATGPWSFANVPTLTLPAAAPFCVAGVPSLR